MAKSWLYKYGDDTILVINKNFDGSELYVNGELCDENKGVSIKDRLVTKLKSGELVSATLEGAWKMGCSLVIDGKPQEPVEIK